jgi:uncharacterized coiled-coil DUF342 family protein
MTIEKLAIAIQKDFSELRDEMAEMKTELRAEMTEMKTEIRAEIREAVSGLATKDELRAFKDEIVAIVTDIRKNIENTNNYMSAHTAWTNEEILKLHRTDTDLDVRLRAVEGRG